jgi:hypothetical protein
MNNIKFLCYVGLYSGVGNMCDRCSFYCVPEHSGFMAYKARTSPDRCRAQEQNQCRSLSSVFVICCLTRLCVQT